MICPKCGAMLQSETSFCPTCGEFLGVTKCPTCGERVELGVKFCPHCGVTLPKTAVELQQAKTQAAMRGSPTPRSSRTLSTKSSLAASAPGLRCAKQWTRKRTRSKKKPAETGGPLLEHQPKLICP